MPSSVGIKRRNMELPAGGLDQFLRIRKNGQNIEARQGYVIRRLKGVRAEEAASTRKDGKPPQGVWSDGPVSGAREAIVASSSICKDADHLLEALRRINAITS